MLVRVVVGHHLRGFWNYSFPRNSEGARVILVPFERAHLLGGPLVAFAQPRSPPAGRQLAERIAHAALRAPHTTQSL